MKRWIPKILVLCVVTYAGYWAFEAQRAGMFALPDLPDGAYTVSFRNGLRGIILDADVPDQGMHDAHKYLRQLSIANPDRKYLGVPFDVQPWFRDAWSWCKPPTVEEQVQEMPDDLKRLVENARFEAVCRLDVDGAEIVRGLVFSVPKL